MLISLTEYSKRIGREPSVVRKKAEKGHFETAVKIGRNWVIDSEEHYKDNRKKESTMTIKEVLNITQGYTDYEIYAPKFGNDDINAWAFYTDYVESMYTDESVNLDAEVITYSIMDVEDLNRSIYSNCGMTAEELGYAADDKILMILVKRR